MTKELNDISEIDLNIPISKSETSRALYANKDINVDHDKITISLNQNKEQESDNVNEKLQNKKEQKNDLDSDEYKWFYTHRDSITDKEIYKLDKNGNLIAKFDANLLDNITDKDDKKLSNIIKEATHQINFIKEQEQLKEEIKGYPEYNEAFIKVYKPDEIIPRFKTEKNILRTMLAPNGEETELQLLLSLVSNKSVDYFNHLIDDKVIASETFQIKVGSYGDKIYTAIMNYIKEYNHFPSVKTLVQIIEIPYSEEFFQEYLYDETALDFIINERYKKLKKIYCERVAESLKNNCWVSNELIETINKIDYMTTPPNIDESFDNLEEYTNNREKDINLPTGIAKLDENNAYLQKGTTTTVFAYTGNYKTMFCTNVAYNIMNESKNVLYVSLEISKEDMYINFLSRHSYNYDKKISHSDIKSGKATEKEKKYLFNTVYPDFKDKLKDHIIIYDETDISKNSYNEFSKLFLKADNNFIKTTGYGIDLIVIDHINLLKFDSDLKSQNDYATVNHWMSFLRKNAINFLNQKRKVAVLCACQSSRQGYKEALKNKKYNLTGIAEGNEIERCSSTIFSIFTSDEHRKNQKTQMQILKLRDQGHEDELLDIQLEPKYYLFGSSKTQIQTPDNYNNAKFQSVFN